MLWAFLLIVNQSSNMKSLKKIHQNLDIMQLQHCERSILRESRRSIWFSPSFYYDIWALQKFILQHQMNSVFFPGGLFYSLSHLEQFNSYIVRWSYFSWVEECTTHSTLFLNSYPSNWQGVLFIGTLPSESRVANYKYLSRGHLKWWFIKGIPPKSPNHV